MIPLILEKIEEIKRLCKKYSVKSLEVFGTAAEGGFDPESSDIDFLVEYMPGVDLGPWMAHYFDLKDELEVLLGYGVDLVMSNSPSLKNPYFLSEVNRSKKLLYQYAA